MYKYLAKLNILDVLKQYVIFEIKHNCANLIPIRSYLWRLKSNNMLQRIYDG